MSITADNVADLHARMLHKRLFIIFSEPTNKIGDRKKIFHKHIAYQLEIEKKGILFAAGPFVDSRGRPQGPGMIVIRAKSLSEARRIADTDPFHKAGYRTYRIQAWEINEGGFNIKVRFSNGEFELE
jgi:uncharacterized protein YciI